MPDRGRSAFFLTPFFSNQSLMARRICSDSGAPSRSLTTFRPAACSSSIQNEYRLRGVIGIAVYIRYALLSTRHRRSITWRTHPSTESPDLTQCTGQR